MRVRGKRAQQVAVCGFMALSVVACSGNDTSTGDAATNGPGPVPSEMCADGEAPVLAAYALDNGEFRWVVCSADQSRYDVVDASTDAVHLRSIGPQGDETIVAYDPADGTQLQSSDPPATPTTVLGQTPDGRSSVEVDGIRIEGGQDDPTTAVDATGQDLWTQPGSPAYDNLWAIGDDAVYVVDQSDPRGQRLVAYELQTGDSRWERAPIDPYGAEVGWPWHVRGEVLFTIWSNLALLSTADGSTIWRTDYPVVEFPRMTGVRANDDSVFVAFSSTPSGGD